MDTDARFADLILHPARLVGRGPDDGPGDWLVFPPPEEQDAMMRSFTCGWLKGLSEINRHGYSLLEPEGVRIFRTDPEEPDPLRRFLVGLCSPKGDGLFLVRLCLERGVYTGLKHQYGNCALVVGWIGDHHGVNDAWTYDAHGEALLALARWNPASSSFPMGWTHHHPQRGGLA